VRCSKVTLRRRVIGDIPFRFSAEGLTSYAGLELIRQYFMKLGLVDQIRRFDGRRLPDSDYGTVSMVLVVLMLMIGGGRRIRHLGYMSSDPVVLRGCGLTQLPTARTAGPGWRPRTRHRWASSTPFDQTRLGVWDSAGSNPLQKRVKIQETNTS